MPAYLKASIKRSYAEGFLNELERNDNQYFFFVAKPTAWETAGGDNSPPTPGTAEYPDSDENEREIMRNIIGYKKLNPKNILFALPRYEWESGTVYDQYSDREGLFDTDDPKIFYVVTDENNLYKCLTRQTVDGTYNGQGKPSTIKPTGTLTTPFALSDGYTWKYLATIRSSDLPYELTDYIPVDFITSRDDTESTNQYAAQATAVSGEFTRLDFITNGGVCAAAYNQTQLASNTALRLGTYAETAGEKIVKLKVEDSGNVQNPANKAGYILRVVNSTTNPQTINNYGVITESGNTGASNELVYFKIQDDAIDFTVTNPSVGGVDFTTFEILPRIRITGDGSGAYAFPVMDSSNNTITGVNLINRGEDYTQASVFVTTSIATQPTKIHPTITPVLAPKGGHGSNILKELNVKDIIVIVEVLEEDEDKFIGGGSYRQFGIVKNPILNNGSKTVAGSADPYYRDITLLYDGSQHATRDLNEWKAVLFTGSNANFIWGTESSVGSKISQLRSVSNLGNECRLIVKVKNIGGNYITYQSRPNDLILTFSGGVDITGFITGETVTQNIPAGTTVASPDPNLTAGISYGYDINTTGTVVSRQTNKLIVRTERNSFVSGQVEVIGSASGASAAPSAVAPRYGEYSWVYNPPYNAFYSEGGTYDIFRIIEVGSPYFDLNETPAYTGLTILSLGTSVSGSTGGIDVTSAALTQNSFSNGDFVQQGSSGDAFGSYASGTVYNWEFINSSSGRLYLTDVFGTFRNVSQNGITGSTLGAYIVTDVASPDIDPSSGEIIYINNIRPISRVKGQSEEFRLRLGF
jgi:hypothetical protein